jgi:hypothetical protein
VSTAQWLSVLFTVVAAAVGYGVLKQSVAAVRSELARLHAETKEAVNELRAARDRQGERIGKLEIATEVQKAVSDLSRGHDTGGVPR